MKVADVIVVGAGLGGLALAALLGQQGREVLVLEAEDSATSRTQGGTLDLHARSGQLAVARLGLAEQVAMATVPQ